MSEFGTAVNAFSTYLLTCLHPLAWRQNATRGQLLHTLPFLSTFSQQVGLRFTCISPFLLLTGQVIPHKFMCGNAVKRFLLRFDQTTGTRLRGRTGGLFYRFCFAAICFINKTTSAMTIHWLCLYVKYKKCPAAEQQGIGFAPERRGMSFGRFYFSRSFGASPNVAFTSRRATAR